MPNKIKIIVNKIKNQEQSDKPKIFKNVDHNLYLELIENKEKIKKDLINTFYEPKQEIPQVQNDLDILPEQKPNVFNEKPDMINLNNHFVDDKYKKHDRNDEYESDEYSRSSRSSYSRSRGSRSSYSRSRGSRSSYSRSSYSRSRSSVKSNFSDRLFDLLKDDGKNIQMNNDQEMFKAPTLQELNDNGKIHIEKPVQDASNFDNTDDEDKKRELLFKFELLKKSYKNINIPEYNIHTDITTIKRSYEDTVKRVTIDSNVESYKTYLIGGFMAIEYGLGYFLKFDMKGFTQQQMVNINSYEILLIELGEKSYVPKAKQWPVEIRLIFLILFNAAVFVVSKMILKGTGSNLLNMMNNMTNSVIKSPLKKRKMKGPDVEIDDLPEGN